MFKKSLIATAEVGALSASAVAQDSLSSPYISH